MKTNLTKYRSGKKVYKFNKHGELLRSYRTSGECAKENDIKRHSVYAHCQHGSLCDGKYYLSFNDHIYLSTFSLKKSTIEVIRDVETIATMSRYRDNLALTIIDNFDRIPVQQRLNFIKEFAQLTQYLCST